MCVMFLFAVDVDVARSPDAEASIADLLGELNLVPWDIAAVMPGKSGPVRVARKNCTLGKQR